MNQAVNETEASKILSIAVKTLRNWRFKKRGPDYMKLGKAVRYRTDDLTQYMEENIVKIEK
jgi:hypothetical protein